MKAADLSSNTPKHRRFRSLRSKVFLPFFLLILALCTAAIWGSIHLAERSFKNSADERLAVTQEVLYREIKKQEIILQTYAVILQQYQSISERFRNEGEIAILQDRLYNALEEMNISTAFYPVDIRGLIQKEELVALFDQVRRSDRPRFRYSDEFGSGPVLMVAAPIHSRGIITQILLLKTDMGDAFLHNVSSALHVGASLMKLDGQIVASSSTKNSAIKLTPAQLTMLDSGQPLYLDNVNGNNVERHLFTMIPLGTSDRVLLSLEASLNASTKIQQETMLNMVLSMIVVIIVCTIIFFRRVSVLTQPVRELRNAVETISRGNLNYRIQEIANDELGEIAVSFNHMAAELEKSYEVRASKDIEAALAQQESKVKLVMERKERARDKLNAELSVLQRETSALYQLNQAMTASIDLTTLFDRIFHVMNDILACDHIVLLVHNLGDSTLEVVRTAGIDTETLRDIRFTFNQGITGEAAQSQRMIYVKNVDEDDRNLSYHGQLATRGSLISTPLIVKGRLVGVINLHKKQVDAFSLSEQKLIQAVANQTAIALDNAQLVEKSRESSNTDELTGLANRRHFQEILKREVAQARRFRTVFSIIMCDIDGFKKLKSTLGNIYADALLRQVGQTLLKNTRGIDLVSRFGNDQFIIMLPKTDKQGGVAAAEKLRKHFGNENFSHHINTDVAFKVTLSFGVTEFPGDSKNIYELLNLADRALYAAKQDGCNCTVAWEGPASGPD